MIIRNGNLIATDSYTVKVGEREMTCTTEARALRWEAYFLGEMKHPLPSKSDCFDVASQAHSLWKSWADSLNSDPLVLHYSDSEGEFTWEFPVGMGVVKYWVALDQGFYEVHIPLKRFYHGGQLRTASEILKLERAGCPELTVEYAK